MNQAKKLVTASLFCGLCCVLTMAIAIPSPMNGYVHLGDSMVLLSGFLLSPLYGALAAGIGSMLADIFTGYSHYAAATFIIKALMALLAHFICRALIRTTKKTTFSLSCAAIVAEGVMVLGYFFYAALLMGRGLAAAASIPGNLIQAAFGAVSSVAFTLIIRKNKLLAREFDDITNGSM
jgi:Predicted membrane protein